MRGYVINKNEVNNDNVILDDAKIYIFYFF